RGRSRAAADRTDPRAGPAGKDQAQRAGRPARRERSGGGVDGDVAVHGARREAGAGASFGIRAGCRMGEGMTHYQDPAESAAPQKSAREYRVYPALIEACAELEPVTTAVAHPCDEASLRAAIEAAEADLIRPILVGPEAKIRAVAEQCGLDRPYRLVDVPHSHAAAARAVEIVRAGEAETLMKGSLHTDELMAEVVRKET